MYESKRFVLNQTQFGLLMLI